MTSEVIAFCSNGRVLLCRMLACLAAFTLFAGQAWAQKVEIKLATILPAGTAQHFVLKKLDEDWRRASGETVRFRLIDGQSDGEGGIVRKMNANVYHAAMMSAVGLSEIEEAVAALQKMPLVFRNWEEVDFVRERVHKKLEAKLAAKGYVVLFWGDAGWVNFFSKQKGLVPQDFKKMKMFTWAGDNAAVELMKQMGYNPIALETADILSGFSTGMIQMAPIPPLFALGAQINTVTEHLLEVNWAPIVGATVIKKQTWDKVPPEMQQKLLPLAAEAGKRMRTEGRKAHDEAVASMKKRGLNVHAVPPDLRREWDQLAAELAPRVRGKIVSAPIFDEVQQLLKEFRAAQAAGK